MRVPEEVGKEIQKKKVFVEITTEKFPNLIKKKKSLHIQEANKL